MRKLWDAGVFPRPAEFSDLSTLWSSSHAECTDRWLRMLRLQSQQGEEELHALRWAERSQASEQSRQAAIARFTTEANCAGCSIRSPTSSTRLCCGAVFRRASLLQATDPRYGRYGLPLLTFQVWNSSTDSAQL
jgi:hypothetical protein